MESTNSVEIGSASVGVVEEMLKKLRRCLDLNSDIGPNSSSTSSAQSTTQSTSRRRLADEDANKKSSVALILDATFNGIRMERVVWQAWIQMFKNFCGSSARSRQAVDLDLIVLILLYQHEPSRKQAEIVLKKCVKTGFLTKSIVKSVFERHGAVLTEYLKSIVKITNTLVQTGEGS